MGVHVVKVPDIGEGITEAELTAWHVKPGDTVKEDQALADVMTDKATVEIPSPVAGKVVALGGDVGAMLAVGSELIRIQTGEMRETKSDRPIASPSVRRRAWELGLDLKDVRPSGTAGRIMQADLDAHVAARGLVKA